MGIELAFNKQLTGVNGVKKVKQDTSGYQINDSQQTPKKRKMAMISTQHLITNCRRYWKAK